MFSYISPIKIRINQICLPGQIDFCILYMASPLIYMSKPAIYICIFQNCLILNINDIARGILPIRYSRISAYFPAVNFHTLCIIQTFYCHVIKINHIIIRKNLRIIDFPRKTADNLISFQSTSFSRRTDIDDIIHQTIKVSTTCSPWACSIIPTNQTTNCYCFIL